MTTNLKVAKKESTYAVIIEFFDEAEAAEDVKTAKWTLTDASGNIINNNDEVAILNPSSVETIVLSGDDLALYEDETDDTTRGKRFVIAEATYDSDLGNDLPLNGEASFTIRDIHSIPDQTR